MVYRQTYTHTLKVSWVAFRYTPAPKVPWALPSVFFVNAMFIIAVDSRNNCISALAGLIVTMHLMYIHFYIYTHDTYTYVQIRMCFSDIYI